MVALPSPFHRGWTLTRRVLAAALLAGGCAGALSFLAPSAAMGLVTGELTVTPAAVAPGQIVQVTATGLQPRSLYSLQVCGAAGQSSSGCVLSSSETVAATDYGTFTTTLQVQVPPDPCPCVIAAFSQPFTKLALTYPVQIQGASYAPVTNKRPADLTVESANVTGSPSWAERFGASARRTLALTVANNGGTDAVKVSAVVDVSGTPTSSPNLNGLQPGQRRTYRVSITLPSFTTGTKTVSGQVTAQTQNSSLAGSAASFKASTTVTPWGLIAIGCLIAFLILLLTFAIILALLRRFGDWRRSRRGLEDGEQPLDGQTPVPIGPRFSESGDGLGVHATQRGGS